jgi:hypothetical protein
VGAGPTGCPYPNAGLNGGSGSHRVRVRLRVQEVVVNATFECLGTVPVAPMEGTCLSVDQVIVSGMGG